LVNLIAAVVPSAVPLPLSASLHFFGCPCRDFFNYFFGLLIFLFNSLFSFLTISVAFDDKVSCLIALDVLLYSLARTVDFDFLLAEFTVSAWALVASQKTSVSTLQYLGALVLTASQFSFAFFPRQGPLSALDVQLGEAAVTPHPDDQSTRLALARMAGAGARVCTRPRFVATCLATAAVAAGVNLAGGVLDLVTGAPTGVVTAGQSPPTRTTAGTRLGQVARPVGSLMTTQTGHRHRHLAFRTGDCFDFPSNSADGPLDSSFPRRCCFLCQLDFDFHFIVTWRWTLVLASWQVFPANLFARRTVAKVTVVCDPGRVVTVGVY